MRIFEYAVIFGPSKAEEKAGIDNSILVVPPTPILAGSEREVMFAAVRSLPLQPDGTAYPADRLEVAVRPF